MTETELEQTPTPLDQIQVLKGNLANEEISGYEDYDLQLLGIDITDEEAKAKYVYKVPHSKEEVGLLENSDYSVPQLYAEDLLYVWGARIEDTSLIPFLGRHRQVVQGAAGEIYPATLSSVTTPPTLSGYRQALCHGFYSTQQEKQS